MRLWTIHPQYLDTKGLLAVWREGLLAQKVLKGETTGYRSHPQLLRFKSAHDPLGAIAKYLRVVYEEACRRGYQFTESKIAPTDFSDAVTCTRGQLLYEWRHLKEKLRLRDAKRFAQIAGLDEPSAHPLFKIIEGDIEAWEIIKRPT